MDELKKNNFSWFNSTKFIIDNPPKWFFDPYKKVNFDFLNKHWSKIDEKDLYDLKNIWELSRWNWASKIARAWQISGDESYLEFLNSWLESWSINNPVNYGFNWMCGQEISIRLINTLISWRIIKKNDKSKEINNIEEFVMQHLERINQTLIYAKTQNNNHWISEASALFIGGIWLSKNTNKKKLAKAYEIKGRKNLEESIKKLIMEDGTFAQYSTNYHRFLIDTITQVELWRQWGNKKSFSWTYYNRCKSACLWLSKFINSKTGFCPNLGANDGCFCYQLHTLDYPNYKPTIQLGFIVFFNKYVYKDGPWDEPLYWLGINKRDFSQINLKNTNFEILDKGGFAIMRRDPNFLAVMRIPKFKFRPSQADPLHLDLWLDGTNILRDGGSFSYSLKSKYLSYFSGIKSHNSAEFDGREPMIKISRFLWGNWLDSNDQIISKDIKSKNYYFESGYKFDYGKHKRKVIFNKNLSKVEIIDSISKFKKKAILRWRLYPTRWRLEGTILKSDFVNFSFSFDKKVHRIKLTEGYESCFYNQLRKIPIVELHIKDSPCEVRTIIRKNIA